MEFIVAVDGPAGSGKGTITKIVGEKENLIYIDTGALYRCVTLCMIRKNVSLEETEKINDILENINIEFIKEGEQKQVYLNGENVSRKIRENDVNKLVSQVSHIVIVRNSITDLSRRIAKGKEVIMEGRDIGTNVFPNADVKIYLDATPEERAKRRLKQNEEKGIKIPFEEIVENIKFRDNNDKTSSVAPLKQAEVAIYLDSSNMTIEEVAKKVIEIINQKRK